MYELEGVVQMHNAHFWTLCTGIYYGTVTLDVMAGTDLRRTLATAKSILTQVHIGGGPRLFILYK